MSDKRDYKVAVESIKVAEAPALAPQIIEEYVLGKQYQSDEELLDAVIWSIFLLIIGTSEGLNFY